jgi:acetate kinase
MPKSRSPTTPARAVITQLAPGDVFGVMSLLTGDRIVADVIAGNRCFVLMIPQEVFNTHILTNPKAVGYLSRLLADRTRAMSVDRSPPTPCCQQVRRSLCPVADSPMRRARSSCSMSASARFISASTTPRTAVPTCTASSTTPTSSSAHITVMVGPQQQTMEHAPFKLSDLFKVMQEATALLGDAFTFHPEDVTRHRPPRRAWRQQVLQFGRHHPRSSPKSRNSRSSRRCTTRSTWPASAWP